MAETKKNPWRVLRPFSRFQLRPDVPNLIGDVLRTYLLADGWMETISPGDPIECVDDGDLHPWIRGTVRSIEKVAIRDVNNTDHEKSISTTILYACPDGDLDCSPLDRLRLLYDDDSITEEHIVYILRIQVSDVDIPFYKVD